jgi:cyclopropane fatty-acyl-phospholipid synthase-like methyltransferase
MKLSYTEIFKYSDILNPISTQSLFSAGKLAQLEPRSTILDLGNGKGFPSILWASTFGSEVEGFDINKDYVEYANARAEMLNLSLRGQISCKDIRKLKPNRKFDVVAFLGLGTAHIYGKSSNALERFKPMLKRDGFLILAEPIWLDKPVPPQILETLGESEDSFLTEVELQSMMEESGFQLLHCHVSSKEDWELYVRPVHLAIEDIIKTRSELADKAYKIISGFKAEYNTAGKYWNIILCVANTD